MWDNSRAWGDYGSWLLKHVGFKRRGYDLLMEELHDSPFEYSIPHDRNRYMDGIALRDEYYDSTKCDYDIFENRECSILEMLVALSIRIEDEFIGDPNEPHPDKFFWEMICNLKLDQFKNRTFSKWKIKDILSVWILRRFKVRGEGSPFPLKSRIQIDQRNREIWDQAMAYLNENY